jgi:NAD(P)-dependent dehydrogenase (short-subunit alcohol dehydrogenase family)
MSTAIDARTAIVTGASSGIGLAVARRLAIDGFALTLAARGERNLRRAAREIAEAADGSDIVAIPTDVGREEALRELVRAHDQRHGAVDVLVNAAGVSKSGGIADSSTPAIDDSLAVNLRAVHLLTRECVPLLRRAAAARGTAYVFNLSSIVGVAAAAPVAAYSAAKAGVVSLTQSMHAELATQGIRAMAICPSFVNTPMADTSGLQPDEMIQPEDIAEAVAFMLRLSPACVVPAIIFQLPHERFSSW